MGSLGDGGGRHRHLLAAAVPIRPSRALEHDEFVGPGSSTGISTSFSGTQRKIAIGNIVPISCSGARAQSTSPYLIGGDYVYVGDVRDPAVGLARARLGRARGRAHRPPARRPRVTPAAAMARPTSGAPTSSDVDGGGAVGGYRGGVQHVRGRLVVRRVGAAIDLDAGRCASVPAGGTVEITDVLSLTLTADHWVVALVGADGDDEAERVCCSTQCRFCCWTRHRRGARADHPRRSIGGFFDAIVTSATSLAGVERRDLRVLARDQFRRPSSTRACL